MKSARHFPVTQLAEREFISFAYRKLQHTLTCGLLQVLFLTSRISPTREPMKCYYRTRSDIYGWLALGVAWARRGRLEKYIYFLRKVLTVAPKPWCYLTKSIVTAAWSTQTETIADRLALGRLLVLRGHEK
jgi:hypothetical protein